MFQAKEGSVPCVIKKCCHVRQIHHKDIYRSREQNNTNTDRIYVSCPIAKCQMRTQRLDKHLRWFHKVTNIKPYTKYALRNEIVSTVCLL